MDDSAGAGGLSVGSSGRSDVPAPVPVPVRVAVRVAVWVRVRVGVLAVVVGLAPVLSGCTESRPGPTTTPSPVGATSGLTTAPSPSAPGVAKPVRPVEMDLTDERGAEAAARYFFELYRYVLTSGDSAEWRSMSWSTCDFCSRVADAADQDGASGAKNAGGAVTLYDVEVGYDDLLDGYPVTASYSQAPATWTSGDGESAHISGEGGQIQIDLKRVDSAWRVLAVARAGSPTS